MKTLFISCMALGSMIALLLLLRPPQVPAPAAAKTHTAAAPTAPTVPAAKIFTLVVREQKLVSGDPALKVTQGDAVVLRITSDRADELHLHGYDLSLELQPGIAGELKFTADRSGRFDYELHHAHLELGALEVMPK